MAGDVERLAPRGRRPPPLVDLALPRVVGGERQDRVAVVLVEQVAQVPGAVGDVDLRRGEVGALEAGAAGLARDVVGRLGHQLHQALGAGVRGLVAEARLGVDDARDQRRVEPLVGGLLADDVLVAQRQRDLLHGVVGRTARSPSRRSRPAPRRPEQEQPAAQDAARGAAPPRAARLAAAPRGRSTCAVAPGAHALSFVKNPRQLRLELARAAGVLDRERRSLRLLLLRELARRALVDAPRGRARRPAGAHRLVGDDAIVTS